MNSNKTDMSVTTRTAGTDNSDMQDNTAQTAAIVTMALNGDFSGYTAANVTIKAMVRKALNTGMMDAIGQMDLIGANAHKEAIEGCTGAKAAKAATPVNHTEIVRNRAMALIGAANALIRGNVAPTGINPADVDLTVILDVPGITDFLDAVDTMDFTDIAGIDDIATQKVTKSGERVDIGAHIAKVIEGAESGTFFSVRTIASTSTEIAPNGCPSDGAVAMRLFPQKGESTLIGTLPIKPVTTPVKGLIVL